MKKKSCKQELFLKTLSYFKFKIEKKVKCVKASISVNSFSKGILF